MSILDNRKRLLELSGRFLNKEPLIDQELKYIGLALQRMANGEDANEVFSVSLAKGEKVSDAIAMRRNSLMMHWIAGATDKSFGKAGVISLEKAFEQAGSIFNADPAYLKKVWYRKGNAHLRKVTREMYDNDNPF